MSEAKDIPVIFVSGAEPAKYEPACLAAGVRAFLCKPLDMGELISTIRTVLGDNQTDSRV